MNFSKFPAPKVIGMAQLVQHIPSSVNWQYSHARSSFTTRSDRAHSTSRWHTPSPQQQNNSDRLCYRKQRTKLNLPAVDALLFLYFVSVPFRFGPVCRLAPCVHVCSVRSAHNARACACVCIYFFHLTSPSIITGVFLFYHFAIFILFRVYFDSISANVNMLFGSTLLRIKMKLFIIICAEKCVFNHFVRIYFAFFFASFLYSFFCFELMDSSLFSLCGIFFHFSFIFGRVESLDVG